MTQFVDLVSDDGGVGYVDPIQWRAALWIAAAACTPAPPSTVRGAQFAPMFCVSGSPGSLECPYTDVDLGLDAAPGAELEALVLDLDDFFDATEIVIVAGPDGLYAENPRLDTCSGPKSWAWPTIDVPAGTRVPLGEVRLVAMLPICFAADDADVYRP